MTPTFKGALLLGAGIVGMLDGIVFHQLLQWHSVYMYTDRAGQIASDGLFHLAVTAVVFWGAYLLWKAPSEGRKDAYLFWGGVLIGAGLFNFGEGLVNHHLLGIHHVKPGPHQFACDILYDLSGLALITLGWLVKRRYPSRLSQQAK